MILPRLSVKLILVSELGRYSPFNRHAGLIGFNRTPFTFAGFALHHWDDFDCQKHDLQLPGNGRIGLHDRVAQ